ncbi:hypothetical protein [Bacillus cereus group sp. MYBK95-2]|uniref:hypothetical protein n=1 Tax=Bacillus cereus group sp. MYBK95-2 TaxID=3450599 RepID=UPI003F7A1B39
MATQYHLDKKIYTDQAEWKKAIANDWFKKYNQYMIKEFFYLGRKFEFEGHVHEVLDNNAEVSKMKGWLKLKVSGNKPYEVYIHPKKILRDKPELKNELDNSLEGKTIISNISENHEQMKFFL